MWDILSALLTPTTKGEIIVWGIVLLIVLTAMVAIGAFALGWTIAK